MQIFIFILGLVIGSFLNVLIDRWSNDQSILGRSHCPHCFQTLRWFDLIPIFSFLFLGGRCRYCQQKISWQYPTVEIITGSLFLLISNFQLPIFDLVYYLFIVSCLIVIFVADLKYYIIPDQIIYGGGAITIVYHIFQASSAVLQSGAINLLLVLDKLEQYLGPYFLAALLAFGFFLLLVYISQGAWMGGGDVKLVFLMGLILGWPKIVIALAIAFLTGAIIGSLLVLTGTKTWKSEIPFGTFLAVSTLVALLWGDKSIAIWQSFWF